MRRLSTVANHWDNLSLLLKLRIMWMVLLDSSRVLIAAGLFVFFVVVDVITSGPLLWACHLVYIHWLATGIKKL